jgi:hypothetical protein
MARVGCTVNETRKCRRACLQLIRPVAEDSPEQGRFYKAILLGMQKERPHRLRWVKVKPTLRRLASLELLAFATVLVWGSLSMSMRVGQWNSPVGSWNPYRTMGVIAS